MEDSMKQLMEMLSAIKASQEQMKEDMKRGQEEMKASQEEMKVSQEEMKEEMKTGQEEMKDKFEVSQEKLEEKLQNHQMQLREELKGMQVKVQDDLQEMKTTIEECTDKFDAKLREFEEVVEDEINQVKEEMNKAHLRVDYKYGPKRIEDLETKFTQLSTTAVIKTEGTVTTPSKVKVPTYDGKVARNWREEDKATSLIAALRGEALEVLRTIPEASSNYATLTGALERRYGDAHLQHVYQAQLRSRRQRFEETLQQYEADISRMVNLAYPTAPAEVIEQLSVSSFIEGLRDPEIGQLVRLARHKTISEALAQALEIEAAKQASRGTSKIRQVKTYQYQDRERKMQRSSKNLVDSIKDVLEKFTDGQNSEDSTTNKRRPIRCWTCGVEGHVRSRCPQYPAEQNQGNAN
ncbi:hypothetical protein NQ315_003965 [Exocentrus adspersus]|uniref:CCHC-type domain-containing protein n=1 Tax=Exocentrus adspersus TaxID=1586481 RepID=A0AAV8V9D3_9CUCU|nr:hypothetical protein NQ315_003965 [Exocentrus adspersus]